MARSAKEAKVSWQGRAVSVQPRIRLLRSFDQRSHTYHGFVLVVEGRLGKDRYLTFRIAIGQGAQAKFRFGTGDEVSGQSVPVADPEFETAEYYKTSGLRLICRAPEESRPVGGPPFQEVPPELPRYRAHGHRRLDPARYAEKCTTCIWGCRMPVEIIRDQWNRSRGPDNVTRRFETFCYGPEECAFYKAGPKRTVRGRRGMVHHDDGDSRGESRGPAVPQAPDPGP